MIYIILYSHNDYNIERRYILYTTILKQCIDNSHYFFADILKHYYYFFTRCKISNWFCVIVKMVEMHNIRNKWFIMQYVCNVCIVHRLPL